MVVGRKKYGPSNGSCDDDVWGAGGDQLPGCNDNLLW